MTRTRKIANGLPLRCYEEFGTRIWRIYYQPPAGQRVTLWRSFASDVTKAEARRQARLRYAELFDNAPEALADVLTFQRLGERYFAWQQSLSENDEHRKAASTLEENQREFKTLCKAFGEMLPDDIQPMHWVQYQDVRREQQAGAKANKEIALASAIFGYGIARGLVERNTARGIKRIKTKVATRRVVLREIDAALGLARTIGPGATIQALAAKAALLCVRRPPEILSLNWSQVTDDGIRFQAAKRKGGQQELSTTITWSDELRAVIEEARQVKRRVQIVGLVFAGLYGRQYTRSGWGAGWSDLMQRCEAQLPGFVRFTLQDCRPGGVTSKQERGDSDTLDATMHRDSRMVHTIYDRRRERRAKPAA